MSSVVRQLAEARTLALDSCAPEDLVTASKTQCLRLVRLLGLGRNWGCMEVPSDWMPPGTSQNDCKLSLASRFADTGASKQAQELAILLVTRFALLYFVVAMPTPRGWIIAAPVTWKANVRVFALIAEAALRKDGGDPKRLFAHLNGADLAGINRGQRIDAVLAKLKHVAGRYGWRDMPEVALAPGALETERQGEHRPHGTKPKEAGYRALPDVFVAQAGWRVVWLIEQLTPDLMVCARELLQVCESTPLTGANYSTLKTRRSRALEDFLTARQWVDTSGAHLDRLPFPLLLGGKGRLTSATWPPRRPGDIFELLKLAQMAHLFVFLLSTGGRISEALSLRRGCVVELAGEIARVEGRTYKLVFSDRGQVRDWPIPALGVAALRQQEKLADLLDGIGPLYGLPKAQALVTGPEQAPAMWVRMASKGQQMKGDHHAQLDRMVRTLGLCDVIDDIPLHAHRFRKSIARLIALAIVAGAPKILMDLFGHQNIEMTLHYILADASICSEMEEVAKAQIILLAQDAIRDPDGNGGPTAVRVRQVVAQERARRGEQFGEEDIHSLAQTLTFSGQAWRLVRPGVICTKGAQQSGPCNQRVGHPEPSRCRAHCDHRLETAAAREDTDRVLADAVAHLQRAQNEGDEITGELWQGQVLSNLRRFKDLQQRWSAHPVVAALLEQTPTRAWK